MRHERRTWKVEWLATGIFVVGALAAPVGQLFARRSARLHFGRGVINTVDAAGSTARCCCQHARRERASLLQSSQHVIVPANSSTDPPPVRFPPWWSGPCDDGHYPGRFPCRAGTASPLADRGPNRGGYDWPVEFFPDAWGELEWECVELSMRWLYLEYGVRPYPANGSGVVWDYSPADGGDLQKVANDGIERATTG